MRIPGFHWWRTVLFLIPAVTLYTIVIFAATQVAWLFGDRGTRAHTLSKWWGWLILATTGVTTDATGLDRVPANRSYVFVSNHQSLYDIPVVFWHVKFDLRVIAKASLGAFPMIGWHLRQAGHVLVHRQNPGASAFEQVKRLMAARQSLIVFPEGTRSADGRVGKFRSGIFRLAIESGLPVVPIAVSGTCAVMRKGELAAAPGHTTVEMFDPIETTGLTVDDARGLAKRVEDIVAAGVARALEGRAS